MSTATCVPAEEMMLSHLEPGRLLEASSTGIGHVAHVYPRLPVVSVVNPETGRRLAGLSQARWHSLVLKVRGSVLNSGCGDYVKDGNDITSWVVGYR